MAIVGDKSVRRGIQVRRRILLWLIPFGAWRSAAFRLSLIVPWTPAYPIFKIQSMGAVGWAGAHGGDALAVVSSEALLCVGIASMLAAIFFAVSHPNFERFICFGTSLFIALTFYYSSISGAGFYA